MKYENCKDTLVPYIGEIPTHWRTKRLRFVADYVSRGNTPSYVEESNVYVINQACIQATGINLEKMKYNDNVDTRSLKGKLYPGDVLINSTGTGTLGRVGYFDAVDGDFIADGHVTIVRDSKNRLVPQFLSFYLSLLQEVITTYASDGATNQIELNRDNLRSLLVPLPTIEEQQAIVAYLSEKLKKIKQLIDQKVHLIKTLEEQRKTVTEGAVTRGVKLNVSTKDSGLRWLGRVPEHWQVKRARYYFREVDERSKTGEEELLSVSHMTGVTPRSEKTITMFKAESYEGSKTCKPDDLVINIMWAWMGAMGVSAYTGIVSSAYGVYRPKNDQLFDAEYLDYLTRASPYIAEYNARSRGITSSRARMYTEDFYDIPVVRPPLSEQKEIVAYIRNETQTIDEAIQKSRSEILLIEEYRTTLISEAVTGKIDVRNAI